MCSHVWGITALGKLSHLILIITPQGRSHCDVYFTGERAEGLKGIHTWSKVSPGSNMGFSGAREQVSSLGQDSSSFNNSLDLQILPHQGDTPRWQQEEAGRPWTFWSSKQRTSDHLHSESSVERSRMGRRRQELWFSLENVGHKWPWAPNRALCLERWCVKGPAGLPGCGMNL